MKKGILFLVLLSLIACSNTTVEQRKNLNPESLKENVISGKTTKENLIQLLGEPSSKTLDSNGNEVWVYKARDKKVSTSIGFGLGFGGFSFGGSGAGVDVGASVPVGNSSTGKDYVFTLTKDGKVLDYKIIDN